jgi:DNA-binding GntR family transcriptional regulator
MRTKKKPSGPIVAGPGQSSGTEAYKLLLQAIEAGALAPGTRLREADLAQRFQISRTPVREALKRLESQGLVAHEPHYGAMVATLDYGQIVELYQYRELLEAEAARLAAIHASPTEIEVMQHMVQSDRLLIEHPQELARTNRLFHQQIRDSARNRYLAQTLENLRLSLALLAGTTLGAPGRGKEAIDEHAALVSAIAERRPEAAEAAARAHIKRAFRTRIELLQRAAPS